MTDVRWALEKEKKTVNIITILIQTRQFDIIYYFLKLLLRNSFTNNVAAKTIALKLYE